MKDKDESNVVFPILKSKLKTTNFVYGELSYQGMEFLLYHYASEVLFSHPYVSSSKQGDRKCFVDLGSGSGVSLAAAALSGLFKTVIGIELMRTKVNICREMMKQLRLKGCWELYFDEDTRIDSNEKMTFHSAVNTTLCKVDIIEADFLSVPWWEVADVVYAACTCFSDDVLDQIIQRCLELKDGSLVVLLDRPIHASVMAKNFKLLGSFQTRASWGETSVLIYIKQHSSTI